MSAGRSVLEERVARWAVALATLWFGLGAAWGMFGTPGGGHIGAGGAGTAMMAEQIVRWKIFYPAWDWYSGVVPPASQYYCHHPFGMYWLSALGLWIFGHRDFVVALPAVLMSAAVPPLFYGVAKEHWGPIPGAVAAVAFSVVPIALGFASYLNGEGMCIFGALLFFWGHSRHQVTGRAWHLVASLLGLFVLTAGDWVGFVIAAGLLGWAFVRAYALPVGFAPRVSVAYHRWWAWATAIALASLLLWVGFFAKADKIADWLGSAHGRGTGDTTPLAMVLEARGAWIEFSFTPLAIALGKLALPILVVRLAVRRRDEEVYSLAFLLGAVFQYVAFKGAADVHIFWPHYFAAYYALALAQLAATAQAGARLAATRLAPGKMPAAGLAAALLVGISPSVLMAPDAARSMRIWRETGGRYDDNGTLIRSHVDLLYVLKEVVMPKMPKGASIDHHPSALWGWEHQWAFQGIDRNAPEPSPSSPSPFWIARASGLLPDLQKKIATSFHVRVYGDTWVVEPREPPAPIDAYSLGERDPGPLEWLVYGGAEPMRKASAEPDPRLTWEWRTHLGLPAQPPPDKATDDPEELRILHNAAIERGDGAGAARIRARLESLLDRSVAAPFEDGVVLVGARVAGRHPQQLEVWFEASEGPTRGDPVFHVRSQVVEPNRLSLVPATKVEREMAWPTSISPKLWKKGFLYVVRARTLHRIGKERYYGAWQPRDSAPAPKRKDGRAVSELAVLP